MSGPGVVGAPAGGLALVDQLLRDRGAVLARIEAGRGLTGMMRVFVATIVVGAALTGAAAMYSAGRVSAATAKTTAGTATSGAGSWRRSVSTAPTARGPAAALATEDEMDDMGSPCREETPRPSSRGAPPVEFPRSDRQEAVQPPAVHSATSVRAPTRAPGVSRPGG